MHLLFVQQTQEVDTKRADDFICIFYQFILSQTIIYFETYEHVTV